MYFEVSRGIEGVIFSVANLGNSLKTLLDELWICKC